MFLDQKTTCFGR